MRKGIFREPLCLRCTYFQKAVMESGQKRVYCGAVDEGQPPIPIRDGDLATECTLFYDKLKSRLGISHIARGNYKIPIIGTNEVLDIYTGMGW